MSTKSIQSGKQPIRVCLVEDHDLLRADLERDLRQSNDIRFVGAYGNAEAALPNLLQEKPDVLVLDYGLPGMNGGECIRHLKAKLPAIRILVLTGLTDEGVMVGALEAGADGFLEKLRITPGDLLREIREVHAGNHPLSPRARQWLLDRVRSSKSNEALLALLSAREKEIVPLLKQGLSDKEIACALHVEECTIETHLHHLYEKLHVRNRTEAVSKLLGLHLSRKE